MPLRGQSWPDVRVDSESRSTSRMICNSSYQAEPGRNTNSKFTGTVRRWRGTIPRPHDPSRSARTSDSVRPAPRGRYLPPAERGESDHTCCLDRLLEHGLRPGSPQGHATPPVSWHRFPGQNVGCKSQDKLYAVAARRFQRSSGLEPRWYSKGHMVWAGKCLAH